MNANLPKAPFQNLALSLSGGGYRAASFHLGLMTYLSSVHWRGKTLLERIRIISTVLRWYVYRSVLCNDNC